MADYWEDPYTLLDNIDLSYLYASTYWDDASPEFFLAESEYFGGNDHTALGHLIACTGLFMECVGYLLSGFDELDPKYDTPYFLRHYSLTTWKTIVEAWVKNDFEGRAWTIATIDQMRKILWDEPFDIQWSANIGQEGGPP